MSKPKYRQGKQIESVADFERSEAEWFKINFGAKQKTVHFSFLYSWQYRVLSNFIRDGRVFEADGICVGRDETNKHEQFERRGQDG